MQAPKRTESSWETKIILENLNNIWDRQHSVGKPTDTGGRLNETSFETEVDDAIVQGSEG